MIPIIIFQLLNYVGGGASYLFSITSFMAFISVELFLNVLFRTSQQILELFQEKIGYSINDVRKIG